MFKANIRHRTDDGRQLEIKPHMAVWPGDLISTKRTHNDLQNTTLKIKDWAP